MNNFLQAAKLKLRIMTPQGLLSVEQLWDLSLPKLANIIKGVKKQLQKDNTDDELSFLDETKTVDKEQQLAFDVLKEIYLTKKEEQEAQKNAAQKKLHNEKIMALIHQKQELAMGEKSIEELKAMLMD